MCGIGGVLHLDRPGSIDPAVLTRMSRALAHRGPDGDGTWFDADRRTGLVHRRLSIIDLSAAAAQPMGNEDGAVQVVFNGEIYNHPALRRELTTAGHRFRTDHSDTEVIVHGYEQWGLRGLAERLEGMFAFAVWDAGEKRLSLVRDRVGVKPLYWRVKAGMALFASEIKGILAHPDVVRDIDPQALYHYLTFMVTPTPMTLFKEIYKLPAGHLLTVDRHGAVRSERWWDALPEEGGAAPESEEACIAEIRTRLQDSVEQRMMADVPVGVFLSGGVDSSTNVALMSRLTDRPLDTFTVGFKDHPHLNELEYADRVSKLFKTRHHEILIDEKDMTDSLEGMIHHQDEPIADWVCIPLHFVSKLAAEHVKVVQVGEGADEQFCGYDGYLDYLRLADGYMDPFQRYLPQPLQDAAASIARWGAKVHPRWTVYADIIHRTAKNREPFWGGATVYWELQKRGLLNKSGFPAPDFSNIAVESGILPEEYLEADSFRVIEAFRERFFDRNPGGDLLNRMIYYEFKLRLPELLLMRVDKITMAHSLEARVPFLDRKLVELTTGISRELKIPGGVPKSLLKKAVTGWIPDDIIHRKKMGFGAPMSEWLRGAFGHRAEEEILGSALMERGFFNRAYIDDLFARHRDGTRDNAVYIWTLYNLAAWHRYWIEERADQALLDGEAA